MHLGFGGIYFKFILNLFQPCEAAASRVIWSVPQTKPYVLFPIGKAMAQFSIPFNNLIEIITNVKYDTCPDAHFCFGNK